MGAQQTLDEGPDGVATQVGRDIADPQGTIIAPLVGNGKLSGPIIRRETLRPCAMMVEQFLGDRKGHDRPRRTADY